MISILRPASVSTWPCSDAFCLRNIFAEKLEYPAATWHQFPPTFFGRRSRRRIPDFVFFVPACPSPRAFVQKVFDRPNSVVSANRLPSPWLQPFFLCAAPPAVLRMDAYQPVLHRAHPPLLTLFCTAWLFPPSKSCTSNLATVFCRSKPSRLQNKYSLFAIL